MSAGCRRRVLAVMQALAIGGAHRAPAAGRTSLAQPARAAAARSRSPTVAVVAGRDALLDAPLVVLLPVLVAAGVLSMSWNSLSFAAAVELAGHGRSGVAIGLQQTLLNGPGALLSRRSSARSSPRRRGGSASSRSRSSRSPGWRVLRALPA